MSKFFKIITGLENNLLLPLISEPTFTPILAHHISPSDTNGAL